MSDKVKLVNRATANDLGAAFLAEAKRHLDTELPRACLTTVQGLYLLLAMSCCDGTNRSGSMYRFMGAEMLRRMRLDRRFAKLDGQTQEEADQRRALARTVWGVFLFEW